MPASQPHAANSTVQQQPRSHCASMRAARPGRCARAEHAQQRPQHARAHAHRPIHHREDAGLGEVGLESRGHTIMLGRGHVHAPPASLRGKRRGLQNDVLENGLFQPPLRLLRSARKNRSARARAAAVKRSTTEQPAASTQVGRGTGGERRRRSCCAPSRCRRSSRRGSSPLGWGQDVSGDRTHSRRKAKLCTRCAHVSRSRTR